METPMSIAFHADAWIGYAAATLTTLSFVPQAVLTLRTRDVSGISGGMYACFTLGVALWLCYGWQLGDWPIIVANTITLALAGTILATKLMLNWRGLGRGP
jgi:MtN3 and saliva related transmembrane protein